MEGAPQVAAASGPAGAPLADTARHAVADGAWQSFLVVGVGLAVIAVGLFFWTPYPTSHGPPVTSVAALRSRH